VKTKQTSFKATCDNCQQEKPCLTVVLKQATIYEKWRELANYCAVCRRSKHGQFDWPEATSFDKKHAAMDRYDKGDF
jgi:hypothetical protein